MPQIIVASQNPVKIHATEIGFKRLFPTREWSIRGESIASDVSAQPMSDEETRQGAKNRALKARKLHPDGDFWVGIEGGCCRQYDEMWVFAWVVVCTNEHCSYAKSSAFTLPENIVLLLERGLELGDACDITFKAQNSKHKGGIVGALSHGHIDRCTYYVQPVILALMSFVESGT